MQKEVCGLLSHEESFNNTLVVIGGNPADGAFSAATNDIWVSWDNGVSWSFITNAQFGGRSDAISEIIDTQLYISGGWDNALFNFHVNAEVWVTDIAYDAQQHDANNDNSNPHHQKLSPGVLVVIVLVVLLVVGVAAYFIFKHATKPRDRVPQDSGYQLQV